MEELVKEFVIGLGALVLYAIICWISWQLSKLTPHDNS